MKTEPIQALLSWLLTASLHASVAALLIVAIQTVLSHRIPARWRFGLWLPFGLILLLPAMPGISVGTGLLRLPVMMDSEVAPTGNAAATPSGAKGPAGSGIISVGTVAGSGWSGWHLAGGVWLAGFAGVAGVGLIAYRREMRRIRSRAGEVPPGLREAVRRAADATGLGRLPEIVSSAAVRSPAVTGARRPVLLLPEGFLEQTPGQEADLMLRHEVLHLKHRDTAWDVLFWLLNAAHWFNPCIWLALARLRADRELARDAEVLAEAGLEERAAYGGALLRMQLPPGTAMFQAGFVGLVNGGAAMKRRLARLAHHRRVSAPWHVAGLVLVLAVQLTTGVRAQPKREAVPPPEAPAEQGIVTKAKNLKIERMVFEKASLQEVMDYVRRKSIEVDQNEKDPEKKGVDLILLMAPKTQDASVTLDLKNTSVYAVLENAVGQVGFKVGPNAEGTALVVGQPDAIVVPLPTVQSAGGGVVSELAGSLVVARVQFRDATVEQVAAYIERQSRQLDPAGKGFKVRVDPAVPPGKLVGFELRNVKLLHLAMAVADMAGLGLADDGKALVFVPAPAGK